MNLDREEKSAILFALYIAAIISANLMGNKIAHVLVDFSVGLLVFPFTFLITDIISEVHGKKRARLFVWSGFVAVVFIMIATAIAVSLPFAERSFVKEEYTSVFGSSIRFFIASIIAFLLAELHDVWAYNYWKEKTKGKYLWLRSNLSTFGGQAVDTLVFMTIAFIYLPFLPQTLSSSPKFTLLYIITLSIPYYLLKVGITIFQTPLCYIGVSWLSGDEKQKQRSK